MRDERLKYGNGLGTMVLYQIIANSIYKEIVE